MRIPYYPVSRSTRTLLPHQKKVLRYMMSTNTPAVFIDMRLGKTILSIEYAIRKGLKNVLVLAPKSALNSWERELEVEGIKCCKVVNRSEKTLTAIGISPWVVSNPQKLLTYKALLQRKWDLIIIDESSRIKNARSKYFKTLMRYMHTVPHKILLSGTPTPESVLEAVPQLLFLHEEVLGCKTYWEFLGKYTMRIGYDRLLFKSAREKLMKLLHDKCYFLSQETAGVAQPRVNTLVYVPKTKKQVELFKQLRDKFEMDLNGKHYETVYILPIITWAARLAGGLMDGACVSSYKYKALKRIIDRTPGQIVVWFRFNEELHYVEQHLLKLKIPCAAYYGDVTVEQRKLIEQDFRAGKYKVLLLQVKTGLYALDLSSADTAVYYSNSWSLEERIQSEKRISHPKKKSTLNYVDIVMKGWPDTTVYKALKKKNISAKIVWEGRNDRA